MVTADPWSARGFGLPACQQHCCRRRHDPVGQRNGITISGGQDQSPELSWAGFSDSTQSFIVTMYDPDNAHLERVLALSHSQ